MAGRYHDEIEKLQALYAENPDGRVFTHLAEAYRKAGELDRAKEVLDGGLRRHSDYSSAHVVMGRVLADRGDMHAAAASFRRVLQLDPHNLVALRALGDLARRADRPDEAAGYYREILAMDPGDEELAEYVSRHEAMTGARAAQTRVPPPVEVGDPGVQNIGFEPGDAGLVDIGDISVGGDEGWAMLDLDIGNLSLGGAEAGSMAGREAEAGAPADASAAARSPAEGPAAEEEAGAAPAAHGVPERQTAEQAPDEQTAVDDDALDDVLAQGTTAEAIDAEQEALPYAPAESRREVDAQRESIEAGAPEDVAEGEPAAGEPVAYGPGAEEAAAEEAAAEEMIAEGGPAEEAIAEEPAVEAEEPPATSAVEDFARAFFSGTAITDLSGGSRDLTFDDETEPDAAEVEPIDTTDWGLETGERVELPEAANASLLGSDVAFEESEGAEAPAELVTETMADLYMRQGFYQRAVDVYYELLDQRPGDSRLEVKLAEAEFKVEEWGAEAPGAAEAAASEADAREPEGWRDPFAEGVMEPEAASEPESAAESERAAEELASWTVYPDAEGAEPSEPLAAEASREPASGETDSWAASPEPEEVESAWTGAGGAAAAESSPYWMDEAAAEPAASGPTIRSYFDSLLAWGGGAGSGERELRREPPAEPTSPPPGEVEDDEDLEMFRAWLQSLKH